MTGLELKILTKVKINLKAYQKMWYYTELCDDEILGMLEIHREEDALRITDILIPEQEVSMGSCDPTVEGLKEVSNAVPEGTLSGWFHTHPWGSGTPSPSGIDTGTIHDWSSNPLGDVPFLITLIGNKNRGLKTRLDVFKPIRLRIEDFQLQIVSDGENDELKEECQRIIDEKVKKKFWQWKLPHWPGKGKKDKGQSPFANKGPPHPFGI